MFWQTPGSFLFSLESELAASAPVIEQAILVNGLFSRQVCLTESQMYDNSGVEEFFKRHQSTLKQMVASPIDYEVPLLATCSRTGSAAWAAIDSFLDPKGVDGLPTYLSKLHPEQNISLRNKYSNLKTPEARRARFLSVCGKSTQDYIEQLEGYLTADTRRTVLRLGMTTGKSLYETTRNVLVALCALPTNNFTKTDNKIIEGLHKAMDTHRRGEPETRERLHRAIYDDKLPPVYKGEVQRGESTPAEDRVRDEWRYIVNTIYNRNLAEKYRLRQVLNTGWWPTGRRFIPSKDLEITLEFEEGGKLPLVTPIIPNYLNLHFVRQVRSKHQFVRGMDSIDKARAQQDKKAIEKSFAEHLLFVSEEFGKHLETMGRKDLLPTKLHELVVRETRLGASVAYASIPVLAFIGWWMGQPVDSAFVKPAWELADGVLMSGEIAGYLLKDLFGDPAVGGSNFKHFVEEIRQASGIQPEGNEMDIKR